MITENMRLMVLAAGLGTRLLPLTRKIPKPLVQVNKDSKVIDYVMEWAGSNGIQENNICVNLHHLPLPVYEYLIGEFMFSLEHELYGTAGSLKKMETWLTDPFAVVNGDTITDVDLREMLREHEKAGATATIFTHDDAIHTGGVYIFNRKVLSYLKKTSKEASISQDLIPLLEYLQEPILLYKDTDSMYLDVGTPGKLVKARRMFRS